MYEKYAELLLKRCLNIKEGEPLLINAPIECIEFIRIVAQEAYKLGVNDIYFDLTDDILKRDQLENLDINSLKESKFWNKTIWNEYANKGAAFLMLYGDDPEMTNGIDSEKIAATAYTSRTSRKIYKEKQGVGEVSWCIASVATEKWANKVFQNSLNPKEELWNAIFKMCYVDKENPVEEWNKLVSENKERCEELNKYKIKKMHYTNGLGTDLFVELSDLAIWSGGAETLKDGREAIVNMPTIEVFTTPILSKTEGIVYSSKPLVYNGTIIDEFYLEFKEGKVVNFDAKIGKEVLKSIIEADKNSAFLGEVALVEHDSVISKSNILFYETLFDENASCHLALGAGFPTAIKEGTSKSKEELLNMGVNESDVHVDFMIGTEDLNITGITYDNKEINIFTHGKFDIK